MVVVLERMNMAIAASIGLVAEAIHRHKTPETPTESMLVDYPHRNWYDTDKKINLHQEKTTLRIPPWKTNSGRWMIFRTSCARRPLRTAKTNRRRSVIQRVWQMISSSDARLLPRAARPQVVSHCLSSSPSVGPECVSGAS